MLECAFFCYFGVFGERVYFCFKPLIYMSLKWCQRGDLNSRPMAYESTALPLSYSGLIVNYKQVML